MPKFEIGLGLRKFSGGGSWGKKFLGEKSSHTFYQNALSSSSFAIIASYDRCNKIELFILSTGLGSTLNEKLGLEIQPPSTSQMNLADSADDEDDSNSDLEASLGGNSTERDLPLLITTATYNDRYNRDDVRWDDSTIAFIAARIPYLNAGVLTVIVQIVELFIVICGFLAIINIGIPQTLGDWAPPVLTGQVGLYLLSLIVMGIIKPPSDKVYKYVKPSDKPAAGEYARLVNFSDIDVMHYSIGFLTHFVLMCFYWGFFVGVLNGSSSGLSFSTNPTAYLTQFAIDVIWTLIDLAMFCWWLFATNLGSNMKAIALQMLGKKSMKNSRKRR